MQGLSMAVDLALGPGHGAGDSQDALPTPLVHKPGPPRVLATWHLVQFSGLPMKSAFAASLDFDSLDRAFLSPQKVPRSGLQWGRRQGGGHGPPGTSPAVGNLRLTAVERLLKCPASSRALYPPSQLQRAKPFPPHCGPLLRKDPDLIWRCPAVV